MPGVSVKPFKPWEREVTLECKISFTLYCQGARVNCAVHKVFLLNEAVIIAVCWARDLGMGHSPCSRWLFLWALCSLCLPFGALCWASNFSAARPWKTCFHQAKMYGLLPKWMAAYKYSVVFYAATKPNAGVTAWLFPALHAWLWIRRVRGLGWMLLCKEGQSNVHYSEEKPWQRGQKGFLFKPWGAAQKLSFCL